MCVLVCVLACQLVQALTVGVLVISSLLHVFQAGSTYLYSLEFPQTPESPNGIGTQPKGSAVCGSFWGEYEETKFGHNYLRMQPSRKGTKASTHAIHGSSAAASSAAICVHIIQMSTRR